MKNSQLNFQFLGGTGTVAGSKFLLSTGSSQFLVDCGLFQGLKEYRLRNWDPFLPEFRDRAPGGYGEAYYLHVNGDEHEVWIAAPDGQRVVAATKWNGAREYTVQFVAEKTGVYQLVCSEHAPSMIATFLVLPRR